MSTFCGTAQIAIIAPKHPSLNATILYLVIRLTSVLVIFTCLGHLGVVVLVGFGLGVLPSLQKFSLFKTENRISWEIITFERSI